MTTRNVSGTIRGMTSTTPIPFTHIPSEYQQQAAQAITRRGFASHPPSDRLPWTVLVRIDLGSGGDVLAGNLIETPGGIWATVATYKAERVSGRRPDLDGRARVSFYPWHRIRRVDVLGDIVPTERDGDR